MFFLFFFIRLPAVHKHTLSPPFLAHLLFHRSQRNQGWPLQHIKFYISQLFYFLFFYSGCWVRAMLSTYLFLSGWSLSLNMLLTWTAVFVATWGQKGHKTVPVCFCMCSINVYTPPPLFYVKSAVNTMWVAQLVLFMNMCPWRHPLSSVVTKSQCRNWEASIIQMLPAAHLISACLCKKDSGALRITP